MDHAEGEDQDQASCRTQCPNHMSSAGDGPEQTQKGLRACMSQGTRDGRLVLLHRPSELPLNTHSLSTFQSSQQTHERGRTCNGHNLTEEEAEGEKA